MNHTKLERFKCLIQAATGVSLHCRQRFIISTIIKPQSNHNSHEWATGIRRRVSAILMSYHYSLRTKLQAQLNGPDGSPRAHNDIE